MAKRPKLRKSGAWSYKLKIWYHRQISNFGDGISFGHQDMKFRGKSQNGKKLPKIPDFVNKCGRAVVHEIGAQNFKFRRWYHFWDLEVGGA